MQEPVIATALLIALTGWCAVHCVFVVAGRRYADRRLEVTEFVMALAMAAMMAPAFDPLPHVLWAALLAASAAWPALLLAGRVGRHRHSASAGTWQHYPHHVLSAAALAALALFMAPAHHHSGGGAAYGTHEAMPEWALCMLAAYFLAHAAWGAGALLRRPASGVRPTSARAPVVTASPGLIAARRTVMAIGMFYMLVGMG
ncbi:DUF5134 domain-containing protein [Kitasatospora sp. SUK 42]|uniref:DUF5134 domain-containing protein n=1 Tax=Kitasatospora sp. SUK 42 TaxID=1588882 RepID=UPI0018CB3851|nr:DUF5134 domain-containing protein [Kitasatospora sp. SUK 42]MBV2154876.1 DUF5134 domain-containing protein [Kitasatospora sp. SUK 42]